MNFTHYFGFRSAQISKSVILRCVQRYVSKVLVLALLLACAPFVASQVAPGLQPRVLAIKPNPETPLVERAVFALQLAEPLAQAPKAYCDVWGLRSSVPVEVLTGPSRQAFLKAHGLGDDAAPTETPWLVLRCQTALPDGAQVTLRWMNPKRASGSQEELPGVFGWNTQRFDYTTASDSPAILQCGRANADAGCNPLEPVTLRFAIAVNAKQAAGIRLKGEGATVLSPQPFEPGDFTDSVVFKGLAPESRYAVEWPSQLKSENGADALIRARGKARLLVQTGAYPPLAKFGANFGIAERAIGGIVPLTIRSIEGQAKGPAPVLRRLHVTDEPGMIEAIRTLRKINASDDAKGNRNGEEGDDAFDGEPRSASAKTATKPRFPFKWPKLGKPESEVGTDPDTREIPWVKTFKDIKSDALPRSLEAVNFEVLGIPLAEPGLHLLEVESTALGRSLMGKNSPMYVRSGVLVTDIGVHLHQSARTMAVWVTRLSTGQVVPQAQVSVYDCNAKRVATAPANANGWVQLDVKRPENYWSCPWYVFAKAGDDLGLVQSDWQKGIESWRFDGLKNIYEDDSATLVHAVLARNLLRGGEVFKARLYWREINSKGALRGPDMKSLPKTATLAHTGSNERKTVPLVWDARGNADLSYKLQEGIKRGAWQIEVGGMTPKGGDFRVEDFRLPVLKAEVMANSKGQILPPMTGKQTARVDVPVRLSYLSGGPVGGETVQVAQRLLAYTPRFDNYADYRFGADSSVADQSPEDAALLETLAAGEALSDDVPRKLNAQGSLLMTAVLKKPLQSPQQLLTEMEYRDPNGETYRAQGRTALWPAKVVVGLKADYWATGKSRKVELITLDTSGKPAGNVALTVEGSFVGSIWHRRKTVGGFYSYNHEQRNDVPKLLCQGKSDAAGRLTCTYTPDLSDLDSGEFKLLAKAQDAEGRRVVASTSTWLYDGGEIWFGQSDHDRIDVLSEKPSYKPGETALLQVRSPFRQALAWVNVMRAGAIVDTLVLPIHGTSPSIAVPIKATYAPNVFINVLAVRPRVAEPGATALVDLARPAFKLGLVHLDVSDESHRLQVKVNTDKVAYQSRETAKVAVQVSAGAGQTLSAEREVTVFAIDEALLELLPNNSWDVLKTMMAQRGYGFESASAAMQVIGKRHYGRKALPVGGGGGKSAARELFDTLLLWKGVVPLDAEGNAKIDIPINDSLTRFRVVVVANAGTSQFGLGMTSFVATKDLQVLSGLPATVREGDRFTAGFTIRNTTSLPLQVKLNASLNKVNLPEQALALKPLEARLVVWPVDVPQEVSELDWQVEATAPTANDARQDRLVVKQSVSPALMPVRYTIMGQSVPQAAEPAIAIITPPVGSQPGKGQLRISFSPDAATDASGVRDYMRSYPFYCLEQRTSKAVALKDKALWAVISGSIDQYITDSGLVNYYPNQNGYDGGYDVLTSFVLSAAHQAGWQLPEDAQKRMLDGLEKFVRGKLELSFSYYQDDGYGLTERKLLALEAIARYRKPPAALADSLKLNPEADLPKLSNRAVVQWIDILNRVEWPQKKVAMSSALAELDKRVVADPSSGALHLKHREGDEKWYFMYSRATDDVRAALLALDVPQLAGKADGLARGAVQLQRGGAAWWETQANVWGSLLLDQRATRAQPATGITTVAVGKTIVQHDWSKSPGGSEHLVSARVANVPNGNAVAVLHRGTGKPFVLVTGNTWHELAKGDQKNASLEKTIKPIKRQTAGQWTAGDIAEVQIKFKASGAGWVVINDPIVPGATVLGNGLKGQAKVETADARRGYRNEDGSYEAWPSYVERTFTHVRAYYEYLWNAPMTLTYQVRINNAGQFKMPPTQLEAMYDPTTFANLPNPGFEVK